MATHFRPMYCNVRALGTRTNRAIVTITIKKNPQNYFTQKQCFPLASFIKVIQTPFWNKDIYPPFKGDNSQNTFCTLVRHSTLYTVAYLSTVMDYFSNSSTCRSHCHLPFKISLPFHRAPELTGWLQRAEGLRAPWYWPSGGTSTPEELFSKYHLDVQLQSGPTSLPSDFAYTGDECSRGSRSVRAGPQPHIRHRQPERGKSSSPKMRLEYTFVLDPARR